MPNDIIVQSDPSRFWSRRWETITCYDVLKWSKTQVKSSDVGTLCIKEGAKKN